MDSFIDLPPLIENEEQLDLLMSTPSPALVRFASTLEGDLMVLGVAGKMGVHLAMMAKRALDAAGRNNQVFGVSRFSEPGVREQLEGFGIRTITCDLLDAEAVNGLPDATDVIYMAGRKFGTEGSEGLTWAMNTVAPALVAERFRKSRIVAYSTGCVYDFVPVLSGGAREDEPLTPRGEYSNSTVGRERVFLHYSEKNNTPICLIRLNYAIDLRYGVLRDIGEKVMQEQPIDLATGHFNAIWQGDAIDQSLLALGCCAVPALPLNVSGPETIAVEFVAKEFGRLLGKTPQFVGSPEATAPLSNTATAAALFGYPRVPLLTMIHWVAHWLAIGGHALNKPTHYEVRDGRY